MVEVPHQLEVQPQTKQIRNCSLIRMLCCHITHTVIRSNIPAIEQNSNSAFVKRLAIHGFVVGVSRSDHHPALPTVILHLRAIQNLWTRGVD